MASSQEHINLAERLGITTAELDVLIQRQINVNNVDSVDNVDNVDNLESPPQSPSFMRMLTADPSCIRQQQDCIRQQQQKLPSQSTELSLKSPMYDQGDFQETESAASKKLTTNRKKETIPRRNISYEKEIRKCHRTCQSISLSMEHQIIFTQRIRKEEKCLGPNLYPTWCWF